MAKLILTNGDSAAGLLREAGLVGDATLLAWRDVLHDGPVPLTGSDDEFNAVRCRYLAEAHGADQGANQGEIEAFFAERTRIMDDHSAFGEIEIWLEHDLYDQLQLLQILDRLNRDNRTDGVWLVQASDHLGLQTPTTIGRFLDLAHPIGPNELAMAHRVWAAFRAPAPEPFAACLNDDLSSLPFLKPAVLRMLEELPGAADGLTRTQRTALRFVDDGQTHPGKLFGAVQEAEDAAFMGDTSFFLALEELMDGPEPALAGSEMRYRDLAAAAFSEAARARFSETPLAVTAFGQDVLGGRADFAASNPIDRCWGGTHLTNAALWRWDGDRGALMAP